MKKLIAFLMSSLIIFTTTFCVFATETTSLSLTQDELSSYNFSVSNALPGDDFLQEIVLNIEHNNNSKIELTYIPDDDSFEPLLEAFTVSIYVQELGKTVYEGTLKELEVSDLYVAYVNDNETLNYSFSFHFAEETGNECANQTLSGVFMWSCESVGEIPDGADTVIPPKTGDDFNIWIYVGIFAVAICGIVVIIICKKRKGGEDE